MEQMANIVKMLGGEKTLGRKVSSTADLIPVLRSGLQYRSLEAMIDKLDLPRKDVLKSLGLPLRTMARRKEEKRLTADESDRVYRLARVVAHAEDVFEDIDKVRRWLAHTNRALGGVTPLSLLDTDEGARQVDTILGRIEYGLFS